jgi:hypothetical protein
LLPYRYLRFYGCLSIPLPNNNQILINRELKYCGTLSTLVS